MLISRMVIAPQHNYDWYIEREFQIFTLFPQYEARHDRRRIDWLGFSLHWTIRPTCTTPEPPTGEKK